MVVHGLFCAFGQVTPAFLFLTLVPCRRNLTDLTTGQVHLDLRDVYIAVLFEACAGFVDLPPIGATLTAIPAGVVLQLALAVDASRAVRQSIEPGDRDL